MQKRALIVDDSKSARVVLSKMLEKYELEVHAAESAEDAIEHLKAERPDVIFMDHLMPSMDGFQAVQAIKNDPRTATIPILMYTSQGGELYMGQARALGAIGVLPKQLGLTDVAKVLHQLHLIPERRPEESTEGQQALALAATPAPDAAPTALAPAEPEAKPAAEIAAAPAAVDVPAANEPTLAPPVPGAAVAAVAQPAITERSIREALEPLFSAQSAELRRFMLATLEAGAARHAPAPEAAAVVAAEAPPPRARASMLWPILSLLFAVAAIAAGAYAWRAQAELAVVSEQLKALEHERATSVAQTETPAPASASASASAAPAVPEAAAKPAEAPPARQTLPYAYGELPLSGARLEALRTMVADANRRGLAGTVHVTSYAADFCLTGNPSEGYAPAPDDMPANRCDVVGNPFDDGLRGAQRESRSFADYVSTLGGAGGGALTVAIHHVAHAHGAATFPSGPEVMASSWNQAAISNQQVELKFEPRAATAAP